MMKKYIILLVVILGITAVIGLIYKNSLNKDEFSEWNTYTNTKHGYTIQYPARWYMDTTDSDSDFEIRGPKGDTDLVGGDTTWSNYPNAREYSLDTVPSDLAQVYLFMHKIDPQSNPAITNLQEFIEAQNYSLDFSTGENVIFNGIEGRRLFAKDTETEKETSHAMIFLQSGVRIFQFSPARDSVESREVMEKMLATFKIE